MTGHCVLVAGHRVVAFNALLNHLDLRGLGTTFMMVPRPSTRTLGSHEYLHVRSRVHAVEDPLAVLGHFVLDFHQ